MRADAQLQGAVGGRAFSIGPSRRLAEPEKVVAVSSPGRRPFWPLRTVAISLAAVRALSGCSGDHDFLAHRPVDAATAVDAGGAADIAADDGRISQPPVDVRDAETSEMAGEDRVDVSEPPEPPGRWTLTWTNGLVDAPSARFCFVPVVGGREMREQVVLEPAGGLPFGRSLVLPELRGVDLSKMGVQPYAVVGDGAALEGGSGCAVILDALDGAAAGDGAGGGPVAVALPFIPPGTLAEGRSYLGVVTGCATTWPFAEEDADAANDADAEAEGGSDAARDAALGNDASADAADAGGDAAEAGNDAADASDAGTRRPDRAATCGGSSRAPNAGLVLVRLSRRDVGARFGLQAAHASVAVAGARVVVERAGGSAPAFSAELMPSQIVPRDGLNAVTREEFGTSLGGAVLRVASPVSAFPSAVFSFGSVLGASGIEESSLVEGDLLSLVLIGARPGPDPGPPWNPARVAIVRNAPLTGGD